MSTPTKPTRNFHTTRHEEPAAASRTNGLGTCTQQNDGMLYIYMVTPPPDPHPPLPHDSQRLLLYIGHLLIYAENTVNSDTIVPFAMCMQTVLLQVAGLICV